MTRVTERDPATHVGAVVLINGTEVPCDATSTAPGVLSGLKVTWGRENRLSQPAASTCDFEVVDPDGGGDYWNYVVFGASVEVLAEAPDGTRSRVFYGNISDITLEHDEYGDAVLGVTAVDPTVKMTGITVGDTPWPQQGAGSRRTAILSAIGGSSVFYWPNFKAPDSALGYTGVSVLSVIAKDVDNQSAWGLITDFLWGVNTIAWPIAYGSTGRPGIIMTGQITERAWSIGVRDNRATRRMPVGDFTTAADSNGKTFTVPGVVVDACDVDLDGTTFKANPDDVRQPVRITWGVEGDENPPRGGAYIYATGGNYSTDRLFEVTSDVASEYQAMQIAYGWVEQMSQWAQSFGAPWGVDVVRVDPDTVTGIDDFHLVLARLLEQTTRIDHNVLVQRLPSWAPWRSGTTGGTKRPNVMGLLQGGTYTYDAGRWVLDLHLAMERSVNILAPDPVVIVHAGDVVPYDHDTDEVDLVADPATSWAIGQYATFTDGKYGWDGTEWVYGGVAAIYVSPGDDLRAQDLYHDDPRVVAAPSTSWTQGTYATFEDGQYTWNGSAWLLMLRVRVGDTGVPYPHDSPNILPGPPGFWDASQWAWFTDGQYHWRSTLGGWVAAQVVRPGDTRDATTSNINIWAEPQTPWTPGQYATFTGMPADAQQQRWTGTGWEVWAWWVLERTNLHPDPRALTMSNGTRPGGLVVTPSTVVSGAPDGRQFRRFTFGSDATSGTGFIGDRTAEVERIPAVAGDTMTWTTYVRSSVVRTVRPEIVWHTGTGTGVITTSAGPNVNLEPGVWTRLALTAPVASGAGNGAGRVAYTARLEYPITAGDTLDAAQRMMEVADSALGYFDGDTPDTGAERYDWTGEENNSTSILSVVGVRPVPRANLATNPHVASATGWQYSTGTGGAVTTTVETGTDTPDGRAGYLRGTITTPDTGGFGGARYDQAEGSGDVGETITVSAYVRTSVAGSYRMSASTRAGSLTADSAQGAYVQVPANVWTKVAATFTTTKAYAGFRAIVQEEAAGPPAGTTVDATCLLIERGTTGEYFDGATPDDADWDYAWTAAADASTSTATPIE